MLYRQTEVNPPKLKVPAVQTFGKSTLKFLKSLGKRISLAVTRGNAALISLGYWNGGRLIKD